MITFSYGQGIDEPIMMIDAATLNGYYYHFDGLGSVIALSDNVGVIVERYSYTVFGEPNRTSDVDNPYMFTGRRYDSETSNYYYRARYYKPSIGRFLQTDPIGYRKGLNLYSYVYNNPINLIDPLGLWPQGRYPWGDDWSYDLCIAHCALMAGVSSIPPNPGECPYNAVSLETCIINCGNMDTGLMPEPWPGESWDPWPSPGAGVDDWLLFVCVFIILLICKSVVITKKRFRIIQ